MNNSWIDIPVVSAMEYFAGVLATAYSWMHRSAMIFGTFGLLWSGFKLIFSRMSVKDFFWDTMFKWIAFLFLMGAYPLAVNAFMAIGSEIGMRAGAGKQIIIDGLTNLRNALRTDLTNAQELAKDAELQLTSNFEGLVLTTKFENSENYEDYLNKLYYEILDYQTQSDVNTTPVFNSWSDRQAAMDLVASYSGKTSSRMFSKQTLAVLDKILIERTPASSDGETEEDVDLTNSYVDLDIYLKNSKGEETSYISPSALFKIALLACQVIFEKENMQFEDIKETEIAKKSTPVGKGLATIAMTLKRIPQMIMCFFCCVCLILAAVFCDIQYVMTILEYFIVTAIAAIFIPLMLFDGTKDIPKKFIPVLTNMMMKIIVITLCVMFTFYLFINNAISIIGDNAGMNWVLVGEIFFEAVLAFILTQNAPKIAQTILTGQPQLSMGEAMAGIATAGAVAGHMKQAGTGIARGGVNGAVNAAGRGAKMISAGQAAVGAMGENASTREKIKAAIGGAGSAATADLKDRVGAKFEKFRTGTANLPLVNKALGTLGFSNGGGGGGGSGGGAGGGGSPAYGVTGQDITNRENPKPYSNVSNPNFKTAQKYDAKSGSMRNMTDKEFIDEKWLQGRSIGEAWGQKLAARQAEKEARKNVPAKSIPTLGDNLTGGVRDV